MIALSTTLPHRPQTQIAGPEIVTGAMLERASCYTGIHRWCFIAPHAR